jgi:trehalose 6-phosphate phosphatase
MRFRSKEELTKWAIESPNLWLFLDYDGTLADFAPTPDDIEPDPQVINLLEQLAHKPAIHIAILSGRRLEQTRLLLPVPGIFLAGTYGIELLTPTSKLIHRVEFTAIRPVLEIIKPQWAQIIRGRKGFFLEDKGWTLALHARFADNEEADQVLATARQIIQEVSPASQFRVLGGHKFLEIAPWLASKKETVAYLLSYYPLPERRLIYVGDDDKDEEAFPMVHANQGVTIKVLQPSQAMQPTEADFFFESPAETLRWLEKLI